MKFGVLSFALILIGTSAEAHFRSGSPFVRRAPLTAHSIASTIPRGGGFTATKPAEKVVPSSLSPRITNKEGVSSNVSTRGGAESKFSISRAQLGWAISLGLSVIYLVLLLKQAGPSCDFSQDGFCVTNLQKSGKTISCPSHDNSHWWAWQVDAIFTVAVIVLGIKTSATKSTIGGLVAAVLFHGLLHRYFDTNSCSLPTNSGSTVIANLLYGAFIALISYLSLAMANLPPLVIAIFTIVGTLATVWLSQPTLPYGISPIFMYTQLLVSFVSLVSATPNQLMGDLFVLPCLVSIIELMFCCSGGKTDPSLFNKLGGHVWYDFFLHSSLLATYFPNAK